jgi:hypothetical protein
MSVVAISRKSSNLETLQLRCPRLTKECIWQCLPTMPALNWVILEKAQINLLAEMNQLELQYPIIFKALWAGQKLIHGFRTSRFYYHGKLSREFTP